jgi:hypothetical protein
MRVRATADSPSFGFKYVWSILDVLHERVFEPIQATMKPLVWTTFKLSAQWCGWGKVLSPHCKSQTF